MAFTIASARKTQTARTAATAEDEEFAGLWINVGVVTEETDAEGNVTEKFNRLPRGIAVSDLKNHKVYANTNPDWAGEANLVNQIMDLCRKNGLKLTEGEAKPLNLSVQLYRRQEAMEAVAPVADDADLESKIFG